MIVSLAVLSKYSKLVKLKGVQNMNNIKEETWHLPPEPPQDSDCCGNGCSMCVFDIYEKQLAVWKQTLRKQEPNVTVSQALSQTIFKPFKLISIEKHTDSTNIYTFQSITCSDDSIMERKNSSLNIGVYQYLVMKGYENINDSEKNLLYRPFTPISTIEMESEGVFRVLIKLYKDGKMSTYIRTLQIGDVIDWRGPYGDLNYTANMYQFILMLSAGTGITPMLRISNHIVADENDETRIDMLFSCKRLQDRLLVDELQDLMCYWNFSLQVFVTHEEIQGDTSEQNIVFGRISKYIISNHLQDKVLAYDVLVLICGTESFNNDMSNYVKEMGVSLSNIYVF